MAVEAKAAKIRAEEASFGEILVSGDAGQMKETTDESGESVSVGVSHTGTLSVPLPVNLFSRVRSESSIESEKR